MIREDEPELIELDTVMRIMLMRNEANEEFCEILLEASDEELAEAFAAIAIASEKGSESEKAQAIRAEAEKRGLVLRTRGEELPTRGECGDDENSADERTGCQGVAAGAGPWRDGGEGSAGPGTGTGWENRRGGGGGRANQSAGEGRMEPADRELGADRGGTGDAPGEDARGGRNTGI